MTIFFSDTEIKSRRAAIDDELVFLWDTGAGGRADQPARGVWPKKKKVSLHFPCFTF